ncbi:MAG: hypothetical protein V4664_04215 [Patescibacteria group bacterium]
MQSLSDFLQKFKIIRDPSLDKQLVVVLLKKHCGITVDLSCVQIKNNNILISAHAAIKSAIYMKKVPLLAAISSEFPDRKFVDIN